MRVEISTTVLANMFVTGKETRFIVEDGIPDDHELIRSCMLGDDVLELILEPKGRPSQISLRQLERRDEPST